MNRATTFHIMFLILLAALLHAHSISAQPVPVSTPARPLEHYLNPDGTLNLNRRFNGALDPNGWRMTTDADGTPRFRKLSTADPDLDSADRHRGHVPGDEGWDDRFGIPGPGGIVYAIATYGDEVFVGGRFSSVGKLEVNNIARWNRRTRQWSAVREGVAGAVKVMTIAGDDLYVGGIISSAGTEDARGIARWNISSGTWHPVGGLGVDHLVVGYRRGGDVHAIAVHGNDLYVGGDFLFAVTDSTTEAKIPYLAKWNGSVWSSIGDVAQPAFSFIPPDVFAMTIRGDDLYIGGAFSSIEGVPLNNIGRYNLTTGKWGSLGTGMGSAVHALAFDGDDLYAGGEFTDAGGAPAGGIARWDGSAWHAMGSGFDGTVRAIVADHGSVYVGGEFSTTSGLSTNCIARWNGGSWSRMGAGMGLSSNGATQWVGTIATSRLDGNDGDAGPATSPFVRALAVADGEVFAGGHFTGAGSVSAHHLAGFSGNGWHPLVADTAAHPNHNGTDGSVFAIAVSGNNIYIGGDFSSAGSVRANRVACFNTATHRWSSPGDGIDSASSFVRALAVVGTQLYVGGVFQSASGIPARGLARWDGARWSDVAGGVGGENPYVYALAASGRWLYVGGSFSHAGGLPDDVGGVARWDTQESKWYALGSGLASATSSRYAVTFAVTATGVIVGGSFTRAGNAPAANIAAWSESGGWGALADSTGGNSVDGVVSALAFDTRGDLWVGGDFSRGGNRASSNLAIWSAGGGWRMPGITLNGSVHGIAAIGTEIFIGGEFTRNSLNDASMAHVVRWDGSRWSTLGAGAFNGANGFVRALAADAGTLYAGGDFTTTGGGSSRFIASYGNSVWSSLGSDSRNGVYGEVYAIGMRGKDIYIGGAFTVVGGLHTGNIAHWDGERWLPVGEEFNGVVRSIAVDAHGGAYVGGEFTKVGDLVVNGIAYWDGARWSALRNGLGGGVPYAYAVAIIGEDLYAGGGFSTAGGIRSNHIARWNIPSGSWNAMTGGVGGGPQFTYVTSLATYGNDLYVAGYFPGAGNVPSENIIRWDGRAWHAMGAGFNNSIFAVAAGRNGEVYVGGDFQATADTTIGNLARWDGVRWSGGFGAFSGGAIYAIAVGREDLYIGGNFSTPADVRSERLIRWDGTTWRNIGAAPSLDYTAGEIYALAADEMELYAGGNFTSIGRTSSWYFGHWTKSATSGLWDSRDQVFPASGSVMLGGNIPNPCRILTTIHFTLQQPGTACLRLFDARGRLVATLLDGMEDAGEHQVRWEPGDVPDGIYYYQLRSNGMMETRGMIVMEGR